MMLWQGLACIAAFQLGFSFSPSALFTPKQTESSSSAAEGNDGDSDPSTVMKVSSLRSALGCAMSGADMGCAARRISRLTPLLSSAFASLSASRTTTLTLRN
eukprot:1574345-Rhodomonas_salina.1